MPAFATRLTTASAHIHLLNFQVPSSSVLNLLVQIG
jgi:hypothetical protein